jgi:PAS domain S-box-containing protein
MTADDKVNILLVDDQAGKLLSYEVILRELGENLIKASSGREALEYLLKTEIAVVLVDVCMPDLDGFQLAAMIREHPRFQKTAMIFISAIHLSDMDRLRGYEMGAVDYVPVPVIPEVLRAKVKVFAELYRKTRQLEQLNAELEQRVASRTAELEASTIRLMQSEQRRSLALVAGNMGAWDWDRGNGDCLWDEGQCRIFGVDPQTFAVTPENVRALLLPDDWEQLRLATDRLLKDRQSYQGEFRVRRSNGDVRWCFGTAAPTVEESGNVIRISGVTVDITDRKEAEERQALLAREIDHRAKNALALVQSIVRLTRAGSVPAYVAAVEGRIKALSRVHTVLAQSRWQGAALGGLVEEELAPFRTNDYDRIVVQGPNVLLQPTPAQTLALALHELATNAAKYGALSSLTGKVRVAWELTEGRLRLSWVETGGPPARRPSSPGFGTRIILASIEDQLGGQSDFDWRPEGLQCVLSVVLSDKPAVPEPAANRRQNGTTRGASADSTSAITGERMMIVEDEALVAMAMSDLMTELGFEVVGPFGKIVDAIAALKEGGIDAAILDVNLGGELVYPLAEALAEEGVPFIFVTGYGVESIDRRFANRRVLQKPIERQALELAFVHGRGSASENRQDSSAEARHRAAVV